MKKLILFFLTLILSSTLVFSHMSYVAESNNKMIYSAEITLNKGWNLVTAMCNTNVQILNKANIETLYFYSPLENKYYVVYHDGQFYNEDILTTNEVTVCSSGWWAYATAPSSIVYRTDPMPKLENRDLAKGWNFIAITPEFKDHSLDELRGTCEIEALFGFDETGQKWIPETTTHLTYGDYSLGRAMLVKTVNSCNLKEFGGTKVDTVAPPAIPTSYGIECKDSDNGKDYYTKGFATKGSIKAEDECNANGAFGPNPDIMWEQYCEDGEIQGEWFDCPNGCFDGACI